MDFIRYLEKKSPPFAGGKVWKKITVGGISLFRTCLGPPIFQGLYFLPASGEKEEEG
jgi:hypothetical protein